MRQLDDACLITKSRNVFLIVVLFISIAGCADIGAPPGGPVDTTPPAIIGSEPVNGTVNVSATDRITLLFSERVEEPSFGRAVFISPRFRSEPNLKWQGDRLIIELRDTMRQNQTYVVSLNNTVTDLRRNAIDSNSSIAFSTGPVLDSGKISGRTYEGDRPTAGALVALYYREKLDSFPVYDSLYPEYVVAVGSDGQFRFSNLPERSFRLIAFKDVNRDERLNPYREMFAIPDRAINIGGKSPLDDLRLPMQKLDSSQLRIVSVVQTRDDLVRVRFSRPIPLDLLQRCPSNVILTSQDTLLPATVIAARGFAESEAEEGQVLTAEFGQLLPGRYDLGLTWSDNRDSLTYEGVNILAQQDEQPPEILNFSPSVPAVFVKEVEVVLSFSEPLDSSQFTEQTFVMWAGEESSIPVSGEWSDPFHLRFVSDDFRGGVRYRFEITEFEIVDRSGNRLGDSLRSYTFSTFDRDSLGSISGRVAIDIAGKKSDPVRLSLRRTNDGRVFDLPVSAASFTMSLPPGQYLLSGFIDSDFNDRPGNGTLMPFSTSETRSVFPDTISVRARFETAGIEITFR